MHVIKSLNISSAADFLKNYKLWQCYHKPGHRSRTFNINTMPIFGIERVKNRMTLISRNVSFPCGGTVYFNVKVIDLLYKFLFRFAQKKEKLRFCRRDDVVLTMRGSSIFRVGLQYSTRMLVYIPLFQGLHQVQHHYGLSCIKACFYRYTTP